MKQAIILHGTVDKKEYYSNTYPSQSNCNWIPWLQKQLLIHDIFAITPEIPQAYDITYEKWKREVERYEINQETSLIGHSYGGGFWVRYLSENPDLHVDKVVLVAPWIDPENSKHQNFSDFEIDPKLVARTTYLTIFSSDNDSPSVVKTIAKLRQDIANIKYQEFSGYKHFTYGSMKTDAFPELLEELV